MAKYILNKNLNIKKKQIYNKGKNHESREDSGRFVP
jgi:hypothetical protein